MKIFLLGNSADEENILKSQCTVYSEQEFFSLDKNSQQEQQDQSFEIIHRNNATPIFIMNSGIESINQVSQFDSDYSSVQLITESFFKNNSQDKQQRTKNERLQEILMKSYDSNQQQFQLQYSKLSKNNDFKSQYNYKKYENAKEFPIQQMSFVQQNNKQKKVRCAYAIPSYYFVTSAFFLAFEILSVIAELETHQNSLQTYQILFKTILYTKTILILILICIHLKIFHISLQESYDIIAFSYIFMMYQRIILLPTSGMIVLFILINFDLKYASLENSKELNYTYTKILFWQLLSCIIIFTEIVYIFIILLCKRICCNYNSQKSNKSGFLGDIGNQDLVQYEISNDELTKGIVNLSNFESQDYQFLNSQRIKFQNLNSDDYEKISNGQYINRNFNKQQKDKQSYQYNKEKDRMKYSKKQQHLQRLHMHDDSLSEYLKI